MNNIGLIIFGWLARNNHHWLLGSSLMLFLQWFTREVYCYEFVVRCR